MKPIITATELSEIFNQEKFNNLMLELEKCKRNYLQNHIKGALFINLDEDLATLEKCCFRWKTSFAKSFKIC